MGSVVRRLIAPLLIVLLLASSLAHAAEESNWTVIFRSDDPLIFNHDTGQPTDANGFAISTAKAPEGLRFLRLKRMDTGDYVVAKIGRAGLANGTVLDGDLCWNGNSRTWGTEGHRNHLLGIYHLNWTATKRDEHLIKR